MVGTAQARLCPPYITTIFLAAPRIDRREFAASQQYVAIAVHYDAQTLPRLAAHFYRQAVEERNHGMMIVQYLLDADEPIAIPGVAAPKSAFADVVEPVRRVPQPAAVGEPRRGYRYARGAQ